MTADMTFMLLMGVIWLSAGASIGYLGRVWLERVEIREAGQEWLEQLDRRHGRRHVRLVHTPYDWSDSE